VSDYRVIEMKGPLFIVSHSGMAETTTYRFNSYLVCLSGVISVKRHRAEAPDILFSGIKRPASNMH
jgi:hypothetical protein